MKIRKDEYKCYGFEVLASDDTIMKFETDEGKKLMEKTKAEISFLGIHDTGSSVVFLFLENNVCEKYMAYYKNFEDVRYVGECAIRKDAI